MVPIPPSFSCDQSVLFAKIESYYGIISADNGDLDNGDDDDDDDVGGGQI